MSADVATPNDAYRSMEAEWHLVRDLLGGTAAMRRAGPRWLPREPRESVEAYRIRLNRSVLFNGVGRALETLVGKPMAQPLKLLGPVDRQIEALVGDIDLTGRDLSSFAADVLKAALVDGVTHVLVDYPNDLTDRQRNAGLSGGDDQGPRPYLVHVPAIDLIGWRLASADGIDGHVDRVRIRETVVESDGEWGERTVEQIRVLSPGAFAVYRRSQSHTRDGDGWQRVAGGQTSYPGLPLFTLYANRRGFMIGRPTLMDLAWLNLAHWQSSSDQRHILHVARVPILFGRNLSDDGSDIEIGPNRLILGNGDDADLKFVEHSGAAIAAGRQDLLDLEDRMAVLGLDLLRRRPGRDTATARALDADRADCALAAVVRRLEAFLEQCLGAMATWLDLPPEAAGKLSIYQDFSLSSGTGDELEILLQARLAGDLARSDFLAELQRRGVLAASAETD